MSDQPLAIRDDSRLAFSYTESANRLKADALACAALIGKVTSSEEQLAAVEAQKQLAEIKRAAEQARVAANEPVLKFQRHINAQHRLFVADIVSEETRIAEKIGSFQALEQARIQAAQQAENSRLIALERERMAERANAKDHDELDRIDEKFDAKVKAEAPPLEAITAARAEGLRVTSEWVVTVIDIWALARAHPMCVKIEPRLGEIKDLLNAGVKVQGVAATKETRATVRAPSKRELIEV